MFQIDFLGLSTRKAKPCSCGDEALNTAALNIMLIAANDIKEKKDKHERAGRLCCNKKTKEVKDTGIVVGYTHIIIAKDGKPAEQESCNPKASKKCSTLGSDWEEAGYWHVHSAGDQFSGNDKEFIRLEDVPFFLGWGEDKGKRLDPAVVPSPPNITEPPVLPTDPIESPVVRIPKKLTQ